MSKYHFKSDLTLQFKMSRPDDSDEPGQIAIPDHVKIQYYVDKCSGKYITVERDGDKMTRCRLADDGMTLEVFLPLSKTTLGCGHLYAITIEYQPNSGFPGDVKEIHQPVPTGITLWAGASETGSVISVEAELTNWRFGYSAYELAKINGFEGTIEDYLNYLRSPAVDAAKKAEESADKANQAVADCNRAKADADDAAGRADTAASDANKASVAANTAADTANVSSDNAKTAAQAANNAAQKFAEAIVSGFGANADKVISQGFITDVISRLYRLLGYNDSKRTVTLELGQSGKYIKCATRSAAANAQFAISKPFDVEACEELLIKTGFNPSDTAYSGLDLSVIAIYEQIPRTRLVQKSDDSGNLLYYELDEEGNVTSIETSTDTGYPVMTSEEYIEERYLPNNEDRFVAIPGSGYYVANIPQSCKVVVSYMPGVSDMEVIIEKHGALANLTSQIFGIYEHRTMVEAMASIAARVDALESRRGLLGNATAGALDVKEITKFLYPTVLYGHGVPSADNIPVNLPAGMPWDGVPVFIGQIYINLDATSGGLYYATGHDSVADWKQA